MEPFPQGEKQETAGILPGDLTILPGPFSPGLGFSGDFTAVFP